MTVGWGEIIYRAATTLAGLIAALVVVGYFYNASKGVPIFSVAGLVVAGVIWLIGLGCRYLLTR